MKIEKIEDAEQLPDGDLYLKKDDESTYVLINIGFAIRAAEIILEKKNKNSFNTKAELIAEAINKYRWSFGGRGYKAITGAQPY